MSIAPRPHTSPSITSPPNGSSRQPSGLTGTTSVWPIRHSDGCVGIGSLDSCHHRVATGAWREPFDLEAGALEVGDEQVGVAGLVARVRRAVVDAGVADQGLQQLGRRAGELVGGGHGRTLVLGRVPAHVGSGSGRPMPVTIVRQIASMRRASSGLDAFASRAASHSSMRWPSTKRLPWTRSSAAGRFGSGVPQYTRAHWSHDATTARRSSSSGPRAIAASLTQDAPRCERCAAGRGPAGRRRRW